MTKYYIIPIILLFILPTACQKSTIIPVGNEVKSLNASSNLRNFDALNLSIHNPFLEVFKNHATCYASEEDPLLYFFTPQEADSVNTLLAHERLKRESMGNAAYLASLVSDEIISVETGNLLTFVDDHIDLLLTPEGVVEFDSLFTSDFEPVWEVIDPVLLQQNDAMVFSWMLRFLLNRYAYENGDRAQPRGGCSVAEVFEDVFEWAGEGAAIGGIAGNILQNVDPDSGLLVITFEIGGRVIELTGAILGGVIGGLAGLINGLFFKKCDCNQPDNIIVLRNGAACTMTRTVRAIGSGDDADLWQWTVNEGNSSAVFITTVPQLEVTQSNPTPPLIISVLPICPQDGELGDLEKTRTETIDLSLENGQLGQAGTTTISPGQVNSSVGGSSYIRFINSNTTSGNIDFTYSVPSSLGHIIEDYGNGVRVGWHNSGSSTISVTATNRCTGLQSSASITVTIN